MLCTKYPVENPWKQALPGEMTGGMPGEMTGTKYPGKNPWREARLGEMTGGMPGEMTGTKYPGKNPWKQALPGEMTGGMPGEMTGTKYPGKNPWREARLGEMTDGKHSSYDRRSCPTASRCRRIPRHHPHPKGAFGRYWRGSWDEMMVVTYPFCSYHSCATPVSFHPMTMMTMSHHPFGRSPKSLWGGKMGTRCLL